MEMLCKSHRKIFCQVGGNPDMEWPWDRVKKPKIATISEVHCDNFVSCASQWTHLSRRIQRKNFRKEGAKKIIYRV